MFGSSTELKAVQKQLEDAQSALTTINRSHENSMADAKSKNERERLDLEARHRREISDKDNEIKSLQNKVARIEAEMEARLASQWKLLKEEFDVKESVLKSNIDSYEYGIKIKEEASTKLAEANAQKIIAEAETKWAEIIQKAMENVQMVYKNALDILSEKITNLNEIDISEIADLVRAATEGYPVFPDSISTTSSSK